MAGGLLESDDPQHRYFPTTKAYECAFTHIFTDSVLITQHQGPAIIIYFNKYVLVVSSTFRSIQILVLSTLLR